MQPVIRWALTAAMLWSAGNAEAVGLGPLAKSGLTDGPSKGFYLTLINPYPQAQRFVVEAMDASLDVPSPRATVFPANPVVAGNRSRQLLVIVRDLQPGETFNVRVCAQKPALPQEMVHARVCSKLTARRLAVRDSGGVAGSGRLSAAAP